MDHLRAFIDLSAARRKQLVGQRCERGGGGGRERSRFPYPDSVSGVEDRLGEENGIEAGWELVETLVEKKDEGREEVFDFQLKIWKEQKDQVN